MVVAKWLVEDYERDGSLAPLIDEIRNRGMSCEVVRYIPFQSGQYDLYGDDDCVIFYGSLNLGRQLQRERKWVPGVYCNFKNLCCLTYYSHWGKYLFNNDYIMLPIMEVYRRKDEIYKEFGVDGCIFIRPDSGAKVFHGGVFPYDDLDSEFRLMNSFAGKPMDEIIAVVSSPKPITREWRVVVSSLCGPLTASQYKKDGELNEKRGCPDEVLSLAKKISQDPWQPDRFYVLDICECWNKFFFLEVNSFSCSGLYNCDMSKIVDHVSQVAVQEWDEYNKI
jgi:hypothetical protein